jgi:hypothetical protein
MPTIECFSHRFFLQHNECESYPAMVFILFITILELSVKTMNLYNRCLHQPFPVAIHWHTLLYNVVSSTPRMNGTKKSENVINILWQLCHMLRTSKRWPIFSVYYPYRSVNKCYINLVSFDCPFFIVPSVFSIARYITSAEDCRWYHTNDIINTSLLNLNPTPQQV